MADVNDVGSRESFSGWLIGETDAENGEMSDMVCDVLTDPAGVITLTEEMCVEFQKALEQGRAR